ncbi:MAG: 3-hydroxyacyl-ACP dehydratase FabZ [Acidobacteriota bacterium]|nr:3-hydroxyacyl-ACP dehydratase FabZ [Acidobacteriota bacterium]
MENETTIDIHGIMDLIPHRYPMLLVDRILEYERGKGIVGLKNVTMNEQFFQGHFPERPVMPGVMIIEAMAQTGGVLVMQEYENIEDYVIFFMTIDKVKFRRPVVPGDQIRMEIEVLYFKRNIARLKGTAFVDGQLVSSAEFSSMLVKKDEKR